MKKFDEIVFDYERCRTEFAEFRTLLEAKEELSEAGDVLPFFRERRQLAALLGLFNPRIAWADRIAYEFDVFGDFACDLALGQGRTGSYCFIEFEDGRKDSVFKQKGDKATREWAARFDHGFSQIIDWCFKLDDRTGSADFVARFGTRSINFEAVLVVGRDRHLDAGERLRLDWRSNFVTVNSKKVHCITFDELLTQITTRLGILEAIAPKPPSPVVPTASGPATRGSPPSSGGDRDHA